MAIAKKLNSYHVCRNEDMLQSSCRCMEHEYGSQNSSKQNQEFLMLLNKRGSSPASASVLEASVSPWWLVECLAFIPGEKIETRSSISWTNGALTMRILTLAVMCDTMFPHPQSSFIGPPNMAPARCFSFCCFNLLWCLQRFVGVPKIISEAVLSFSMASSGRGRPTSPLAISKRLMEIYISRNATPELS